MKNSLRFILALTCVIVACSKEKESTAVAPESDLYVIGKMDFFLSDDDRVDSVFQRLDTITYINYSQHYQPDQTFYPYQKMADSIYIELSDLSAPKIQLKDSLRLSNMIVADNNIYRLSTDSLYIQEFPSLSTVASPYHIQPVTLSIVPKAKYEITGEYWRVRYSVSFRAEAKSARNDQSMFVTGKLRYSKVKTGYYPGQSQQPRAVIVNVSEIN